MDEAELLLSEAESKLSAAKLLLENGMYSDAISRAYYSMYYSARTLLSIKKIYPRTHKGVIGKLGLEFVKPGIVDEYYIKAISTARESRERADYGIGYKFRREEAEGIVEEAERFLEKTKELLSTIMEKK